jgi:hypothetical protein
MCFKRLGFQVHNCYRKTVKPLLLRKILEIVAHVCFKLVISKLNHSLKPSFHI